MNNKQIKLSAALISFNEEDRIKSSLASLKNLADETIVIDSISTDKTAQIASDYGAKVISMDWQGFVAQKNALLKECSGEWIIYLDCDEEVTPELADQIKSVINSKESAEGYFINRRTAYLGKILKHSWQPDLKLRLVKKSANPLWTGEYVHESLRVEGRTDILKGEIIHRSYKNLKDHMEKTIRYASLGADAAFASGKKPSILKIIFAPPLMFIKSYFLKGAFLDGLQGLVVSFSAYVYFFLKYSFLWEKYLKGRQKNEK